MTKRLDRCSVARPRFGALATIVGAMGLLVGCGAPGPALACAGGNGPLEMADEDDLAKLKPDVIAIKAERRFGLDGPRCATGGHCARVTEFRVTESIRSGFKRGEHVFVFFPTLCGYYFLKPDVAMLLRPLDEKAAQEAMSEFSGSTALKVPDVQLYQPVTRWEIEAIDRAKGGGAQ